MRLRKGILLALLAMALAVSIEGATTPEGIKFLEENAKKPGVVTTKTGLQYKVIESGPADGAHPKPNSPCKCHYTGKLLDGTVFDSSKKRGKPLTFTPLRVVKGWYEALQLMRPGDKWELYVKSELAYGDTKRGPHITPGAVLIFELELLDIAEPSPYSQENIVYYAMVALGLVWLLTKSPLFDMFSSKKVNSMKDIVGLPGNSHVYLDIKIGDAAPGRVTFELFNSVCPKTCDNFRCLCTGEKGNGPSGKALHYKGTPFHRVIPGFMCQGGDTTMGNGSGGESIYGSRFMDEWENGMVRHNHIGLLSMANAGANTNGSQFFITTAKVTWLDGKHVVFGHVTSGMETVNKMQAVGSQAGPTSRPCVVVDCGEVSSKKDT